MGGCLGRNRERRNNQSDDRNRIRNNRRHTRNEDSSDSSGRLSSEGGFLPAIARKNNPLYHEAIRWKSDVPLTEGQLKSKRDEFWETAPAFEGRIEIWNALRAAANASECSDYILAQAILDGAVISVPNGYLTECYDELGTRYQVPVYCLSYPVNIIKDGNSGNDTPSDISEPTVKGEEVVLKVRLSTDCHDIKFSINSTDPIAVAKKKLEALTNIHPSDQRWFFGGKLLSDRVLIEEVKITPGYVVQVVVNTLTPTICSN